MFSVLGENWFDDYWMNYGRIMTTSSDGKTVKITTLRQFIEYRNGDVTKIVARNNRGKNK